MLQAVTSGNLKDGLEHFNQPAQFESREFSSLDPSLYEDLSEFSRLNGLDLTGASASSPAPADDLDAAALIEKDKLTGIEYPISQASHPLEPLTEAEIEAAVSVIRQAQNLSDSALFPNISLLEPDKNEVLAFAPGVILREKPLSRY